MTDMTKPYDGGPAFPLDGAGAPTGLLLCLIVGAIKLATSDWRD